MKLNPEEIARVCHEVNRSVCACLQEPGQVPWEEAPDWQKASCIDGVQFHLRNPGVTPEQSHENWMRHKEADGWVYGPVKDPEKKQHPCMVPYSELPLEKRLIDHVFKGIVEALR